MTAPRNIADTVILASKERLTESTTTEMNPETSAPYTHTLDRRNSADASIQDLAAAFSTIRPWDRTR